MTNVNKDAPANDQSALADRDAILYAALLELMAKGLDRLTTEGIAQRAGVDPVAITRFWGDHRALFLEAAIDYARQSFVIPDTGNLRDDLMEVATQIAKVPVKGWFRRMFALSGAWDLSEIRRDYWDVRASDVAVVFQQAADRGELRDDIDPQDAVRMFTTACLFDVIVHDEPATPEFLTQAVEIFARGVSRA